MANPQLLKLSIEKLKIENLATLQRLELLLKFSKNRGRPRISLKISFSQSPTIFPPKTRARGNRKMLTKISKSPKHLMTFR
jgi:hypothetical protein